MLVILPPFDSQFGVESVECVKRSGESGVESCVTCERSFELQLQVGNLGNTINVGLDASVTQQWIEDGLDRFVGSPGSLNPVVSLGYKQNTAGIREK